MRSATLRVATRAGALGVTAGLSEEFRRLLVGESKEIFNRRLDRGAEREADEDGILLAAPIPN